MKLPNFKNAFINDSKLTKYCLSSQHPIGKHKAIIFKQALGITAKNFLELKKAILEAISKNDCKLDFEDKYGQRFIVDFIFTKFDNEVEIRTSWIIKTGEDVPRLITCFVKT